MSIEAADAFMAIFGYKRVETDDKSTESDEEMPNLPDAIPTEEHDA